LEWVKHCPTVFIGSALNLWFEPVPSEISGLYLVTDDRLAGQSALCATVRSAIVGGARLVQFRTKKMDRESRYQNGLALADICRNSGVRFIVNDDPTLALALSADGVHLGRNDMPCRDARHLLGDNAIIGVSCYSSMQLAICAENDGATYIALGSFFPSATKPDATPVSIAALQRIKAKVSLPVVAIGGITPENGRTLVAAGADALAVASGIMAHDDPCLAARRYAELFENRNGRAVLIDQETRE